MAKNTNGSTSSDVSGCSTTGELRTLLSETLCHLRSGKVDSRYAASVARLGNVIVQSRRLDLDVARHHGTSLVSTSLSD